MIRPTFLVSTIGTDSHTFNILYIELFLKEFGFNVVNLGPCVPAMMTIQAARDIQPEAIVLSSINGHGLIEGKDFILQARKVLGGKLPPVVIGGQLSTNDMDTSNIRQILKEAGFHEVFCGGDSIRNFSKWLEDYTGNIYKPTDSLIKKQIFGSNCQSKQTVYPTKHSDLFA